MFFSCTNKTSVQRLIAATYMTLCRLQSDTRFEISWNTTQLAIILCAFSVSVFVE